MTNPPEKFVYEPGEKPSHPMPVAKKARPQIPPAELLTPHWHPNSNETVVCLAGEAIVGIFVPNQTKGESVGVDFETAKIYQGCTIVLPQGYPHYFANTGSETLALELEFQNADFDIVTLADVLHGLPGNIVQAVMNSEPKAGNSLIIRYDES